MGRWSLDVATRFVKWLALPPTSAVLDVGCGTGALSQALLTQGAGRVVGVDPSPGFIAYARSCNPAAAFEVGDATALRFPEGTFDAVVSGLALNFVPDPPRGVGEMLRVVKKGGVVAAYVWNYSERMEYLQFFWDAARLVDASAESIEEGIRFGICRPENLRKLFLEAGLVKVTNSSFDLEMTFRDFGECWSPFLGGQGPTGSFVASLDVERRKQLEVEFRRRLPTHPDGRIHLRANANAILGFRRPD